MIADRPKGITASNTHNTQVWVFCPIGWFVISIDEIRNGAIIRIIRVKMPGLTYEDHLGEWRLTSILGMIQ
ncbi:MAG: hypothetical protein EBZ67_00035 [Chitinophagia bacterium]|nr:hypothetical protein [Chitinophagia bacterium]